ncbi:AraC family transcriptional regulator [Aureimonas leprariae]|uniref:AraC family transcriptional regulator n=1 Tax=Plantimonas leprariae TaxID=2615207 RepID=A0A7V7PMF4_9HYPH|nr:AraC family transcriptional regulator [Aureimonas leprariae]KAB0678062.1 AraC family transcriptional regulator [Aureimonas leprariae]
MLDVSSDFPELSPADPLTAILRGLRFEGVEYGRCRMAGDWGYLFAAQEAETRFHFVAQAGCWLRASDGAWIQLRQGDAMLVPRGAEHALASAPDVPLQLFPRWECHRICDDVFDFQSGSDSDATVLFCGSMRVSLDPLHPLLRMMPEIMRADEMLLKEPAIPHLLEAMNAEMCLSRIGAGGILARLADVLAAKIIRAWIEHGCGDATGWIAAMRDPDLGRVIAAVHAAPERDWTVTELAKLMGASRSGFAAKFAAVVGESPARYVAQVRMHQARQWLSRDGVRVSEAARRLGFESEATFSRAFKRIIGAPPVQFRARTTASATGLPTTTSPGVTARDRAA